MAIKEEIPALNLFMVCSGLNIHALKEVPEGFHIRNCREDEVEVWKSLHIDDPEQFEPYHMVLTEYFNNVYAPKGDLFFQKCRFICNKENVPVGTCFIWKAYGKINTIHWLKVRKQYENQGLGRAILSVVMRELQQEDYPVYVHTHPSSYRAVKLYSDFGFQLIEDEMQGIRSNDIKQAIPILKSYMPPIAYKRLKMVHAARDFLDIVEQYQYEEF